jgi:hypothetical protein
MRIAQPLLNSKVGKAFVSAGKMVAHVAIEATYKAVDAAEWVINQGSKAVNFVSKKGTELLNWMGNTAVVKGTIGAVKNAASWIASTDIFKSAVNIAVYVFTKMSNFCTAVVESYSYYNQCRTMARRIVNEKGHLVDEHAILKTFQGISVAEANVANKNENNDDVSLFVYCLT